MMIPVITLIAATSITVMLLILMKLLFMRSQEDREKASPFECGFDPSSNARTPFSLRFFMLAIIFIVFDIEIVLIMPTPMLANMLNTSQSAVIMYVFLLILLLGLFYEWKEGALSWTS